MTYTFTIPHELPDLNTEIDNMKRHWSYYSKTKKEYTWVCQRYASSLPKIDKPIKLIFNWNLQNLRKDPDNIAFAKKYILDGMVKANIISNDGLKQIRGFTDNFLVDNDKPVGVDITIIEL